MRVLALIFAIVLATPMVHAETGAELKAQGTPTPAKVTCYAPGPNDQIEGPWATSRPRPPGACSDEFGNASIPMTLDAVRLGKCKYVTLAANPNFYGRYFYLGTVTYVSPIKDSDGKGREYILHDVIGYVHDTGGAFNGTGCHRYGTCADIGRKFDIAVGDFRGWNGRNASQFVDTQAYCRNQSTTFYQIGGAPVNPPQVTSQLTNNPPVPIVPGDPLGTGYGPFGLGTQPYVSPSAFGGSGVGARGAVGAQGVGGASPFSAQPAPISQQLLGGLPQQSAGSAQVRERNAATLIVSASQVQKGSRINAIWSSVGMSETAQCKLVLDSGRGESQIGQGNNGVLPLRIPVDAAEEVRLKLTCSPQKGGSTERTVVVRTL